MIANIGNVRDWHDPKNADCPQNAEERLHEDCTCKLNIPKGKKKRRARIIFRVTDHSVDMRRVKHELVTELHDDGALIIREAKRRVIYRTSIGRVYCNLVRNHALQLAREAAQRRADRRNKKGGRK